VEAAGGLDQGSQDPGAHLAVAWPQVFLDSLNLMLLSADPSTGNLFDILPGYVAYVALNNAFGIHLWYGTVCHGLMCFFLLLFTRRL